MRIHYDPSSTVGPAGISSDLEIIVYHRKIINIERQTVTSTVKETKGSMGMLL